ncbi:MAG: hypothetical protein ACXVBG_13945 [Isosphaeraceae bacterium]
MPLYALDVMTWAFDTIDEAQSVRDRLWPGLQADPDYGNPAVAIEGERSLRIIATLTTPASATNAVALLEGKIAEAAQHAGSHFSGLRDISATG